MTRTEQMVWYEMARRKRQFHDAEPWEAIRLWGLFNWGMVSSLIKSGKLLTTMRRENRIVWVWPSPEAYHAHIEPLLSLSVNELTEKAGWGVS